MRDEPFRIGDHVRLKTGQSTCVVEDIREHQILYRYLSDHDRVYGNGRWRKASDFVKVGKETQEMPQLFQTKEDPPRFGTLLTKNSKGEIVLEMKGENGKVEAFDPSKLEKVMPHTVRLQRYDYDGRGEVRDYAIPADQGLIPGDLLLHLSNGNLWEVKEIDTKCEKPEISKNGFWKLEGRRVVTQ